MLLTSILNLFKRNKSVSEETILGLFDKYNRSLDNQKTSLADRYYKKLSIALDEFERSYPPEEYKRLLKKCLNMTDNEIVNSNKRISELIKKYIKS